MQGNPRDTLQALFESETARLSRFGSTEILRRLAVLRQPKATPLPARQKAGRRQMGRNRPGL